MNVEQTPAASKATGLTVYDAACKALSEAVRIDEVQAIRNESERIRLYARQARDRNLMADAMEIQLRAERRLGQLLVAAKAQGQLSRGGRPTSTQKPNSGTVTLSEAGISAKLSSRAQQFATVSDETFDQIIFDARRKLSLAVAKSLNQAPARRGSLAYQAGGISLAHVSAGALETLGRLCSLIAGEARAPASTTPVRNIISEQRFAELLRVASSRSDA